MSVDIHTYVVPPSEAKYDVLIHIDETLTEEELFNLIWLWGRNAEMKFSPVYESLTKLLDADKELDKKYDTFITIRRGGQI